jgi:hypothetical protein
LKLRRLVGSRLSAMSCRSSSGKEESRGMLAAAINEPAGVDVAYAASLCRLSQRGYGTAGLKFIKESCRSIDHPVDHTAKGTSCDV